MSVIEEIADERRRQIEVEGYSANHDAGHPGEMALAAACYAAMAANVNLAVPYDESESLWPWDRGSWKPKSTRRDLIRAAALVVAEIERLDRISSKPERTEQMNMSVKIETVPTVPGTPYVGGYYAGQIVIDGKTYALVVAPKAEGEKSNVIWKKDWTKATPGTQSLNDGFANSEAMNDDGHPAAQFCRGLTIGGHTDWYLPSRDELEVLYRNLKPTTDDNWTYENRLDAWGAEPGEYNGVDENGNGHNASSEPLGAAYSDEVPAQTVAENFKEGGPEAFDSRWYWSSTEFGSDGAWFQVFDDGGQDGVDKFGDLRVRAVRKVLI